MSLIVKTGKDPVKLSASSYRCPICLTIMIEPVTTPCNHEMCLECFESNNDTNNLNCPICRKRLSSWARHARNTNTLVNEEKWKEIKENFPDKVKNKLNKSEDDSSQDSSDSKCKYPGTFYYNLIA